MPYDGMLLPFVQRVRIKGVPLYRSDVSLEFSPGLNLVLGANGLGKTTMVRITLLAILGESARDKVTAEILASAPGSPKAEVVFSIGQSRFEIVRDLKTLEIDSLSYSEDEKDVSPVMAPSGCPLAGLYLNLLLAVAHCDHQDHMYFMMSRLLFREEEAPHLLWEPAIQHQVLRLLLCGGQLEREWSEAFNQARNADTQFRQQREFMRRNSDLHSDLTRRLGETEDALANLLDTQEDGRTLLDIRWDMSTKEAKIAELQTTLEELQQECDRIQGDRHELVIARDDKTAALTSMEAALHGRVFHDYSIVGMAVRRLRNSGTCIMCQQPVDAAMQEELMESKLSGHECPLCGQSLATDASANVDTDKMELLAHDEELLSLQLLTIDKHLSTLYRSVAIKRDELDGLRRDLVDLESMYAQSSTRLGQTPGQLEEEIRSLHVTIVGFDQAQGMAAEKLSALGDEKKLAQNRLCTIRDSFRAVLDSQRQRFEELFSEYSNQLLGRPASLLLSSVKPKGQQFEYPVFRPVLDGLERSEMSQTATHERFLLDYAFRMAALQHYSEQTHYPAFFAIEPAEGAMDPVYLEHLARTLVAFATASTRHSLVVITNLRSVDFVRPLYCAIPEAERSTRVINFIQYGRLKGPQEEERTKYEDVWKAVTRG